MGKECGTEEIKNIKHKAVQTVGEICTWVDSTYNQQELLDHRLMDKTPTQLSKQTP